MAAASPEWLKTTSARPRASTYTPELTIDAAGRARLDARLREIAQNRSDFYGCKIAIGLQTASDAFSAADRKTAVDDDLFVWGSVTKLLTGSGILRAVERGDLPSLDTPVHPFLDPLLATLGLGSLEKLFGWLSKFITARHLGSMKSGVPDYDTAKPWPRPPKDPFRSMVYQDPSREWDPADLLNVSWVNTGKLEGIPGLRTSYSSTNFVLLGLLLAALEKSPTWDAMNQARRAHLRLHYNM